MDASSKEYTALATPDGAAYEFNVMPLAISGILPSCTLMTSSSTPGTCQNISGTSTRCWNDCSSTDSASTWRSATLLAPNWITWGTSSPRKATNPRRAKSTPSRPLPLRRPGSPSSAHAAFNALKTVASKPLFLYRPDLGKPFVLQTDASSIGAAGVLFQKEEGQRRIVSYSSLRFNKTEQRYHIKQQECLAVIWAIKRYHPYLEDRPFLLRTDSKALSWLDGFRETKSKLMRWSLLLQEFQYTVEHVPGKDNQLPDALSRNPEDNTTPPALGEADRLVPRSNATTPEKQPAARPDVPSPGARTSSPCHPGCSTKRSPGPEHHTATTSWHPGSGFQLQQWVRTPQERPAPPHRRTKDSSTPGSPPATRTARTTASPYQGQLNPWFSTNTTMTALQATPRSRKQAG
ncbi:RNase H-like domain found in reverse transcriptase [Popillia japonica]|uniref:RNase H-like domain found in reverse transcriptase n=1 Tax=Popillia japonica TaxID=7064 RepID=A0AAW1JZP4_POPJA